MCAVESPLLPIRPESHAVGDLGVNHIEKHVFACGYAAERIRSDYGIDVLVTTTTNSVVDNGPIRIQSKASKKLTRLKNGDISVRIECRHLRLWVREPYPVILVAYDATDDVAYWLYIQRYFESATDIECENTKTLHIASDATLTPESLQRMAEFRDAIQAQILEAHLDHG